MIHNKRESSTGLKNKTNMKCTFLGSMLNFFLPMAICLFLCDVLLQHMNINVEI